MIEPNRNSRTADVSRILIRLREQNKYGSEYFAEGTPVRAHHYRWRTIEGGRCRLRTHRLRLATSSVERRSSRGVEIHSRRGSYRRTIRLRNLVIRWGRRRWNCGNIGELHLSGTATSDHHPREREGQDSRKRPLQRQLHRGTSIRTGEDPRDAVTSITTAGKTTRGVEHQRRAEMTSYQSTSSPRIRVPTKMKRSRNRGA